MRGKYEKSIQAKEKGFYIQKTNFNYSLSSPWFGFKAMTTFGDSSFILITSITAYNETPITRTTTRIYNLTFTHK